MGMVHSEMTGLVLMIAYESVGLIHKCNPKQPELEQSAFATFWPTKTCYAGPKALV